jgi:hypothetical protein
MQVSQTKVGGQIKPSKPARIIKVASRACVDGWMVHGLVIIMGWHHQA